MESKLTEKDIEDFLIRLYFDAKEGYKKAAAKRAYRDFSRTLRLDKMENEIEKQAIKNEVQDILLNQIEIVLNSDSLHQFQTKN